MDIRINEQSIDFTLEEETVLGEVIQGIRTWLGDSGFLISSVEKDGTPIIMDEEGEWQHIPLSDIETLDVTILSGPEQYITDLHTVYQYISILQRAVASGNGQVLEQLKGEHHFVISNLDSLLGSDGYGAKLRALLHASGIEEGNLNPQVQQLLAFCKNLSLILTGRLQEATQPFEELKKAAQGLQDIVPKLMDVPVLLQTGKDREAMGSVIEYTEYADKIVRINHILREQKLIDISEVTVDDRRFDTFSRDFNDILRELIEAFDSQDSVLIGDLLEYEIAPKTETLNKYIEEIEKVHLKET